jgi:transposase-like protein
MPDFCAPAIVILGAALMYLVYGYYNIYRRMCCPKCGSEQLRLHGLARWKCQNCGYVI